MGKLRFDISMSLDGFIAGPNMRPDVGLGDGGEQLHEWGVGTKAFRDAHGDDSGGTTGADHEVILETQGSAGAVIMGRGMFGGGQGPWGEDEAWGDWDGWWGDEPPFHGAVFVLTHHPREQLVKGETTFTFVTDGIESALGQARAAAGDKDVEVAGGANAIQQYLKAGLVDEFQLHVAPVFLGRGVRLFEDLGDERPGLEVTRVIESPAVTHLRYRVAK
jgi:dihydrofolate reductase